MAIAAGRALCKQSLEAQQALVHPVPVPRVLGLVVELEFTHQILEHPQVVEGVNFACNALCHGTNMRASDRVVRQQRRIGLRFVQVLDDGHRLRKALAVVFEQRDQPVRRHCREGTALVVAPGDLHRLVVVRQPLEVQRDAHAKRSRRTKVVVQLHYVESIAARRAACTPRRTLEGVPAPRQVLWHTDCTVRAVAAKKEPLVMAVEYIFTPPPVVSVPVVGNTARFPVHRIYCVGRNYEEHAKEMGFTGREPPFFFLKPADAALVVDEDMTGAMAYPPLTGNLHHEIELVVAIGTGGKNIRAADALGHVFGYAVGLDMTRRDLQNDMKKQGRPWSIGKGFDQSAPIGPIVPAAQAGDVANAEISLQVGGTDRQRSTVSKLIWNIAETIEHLSAAWELQPGDLIYTGTPEGVAAVVSGDVMVGRVAGLPTLTVQVI